MFDQKSWVVAVVVDPRSGHRTASKYLASHIFYGWTTGHASTIILLQMSVCAFFLLIENNIDDAKC